MYEIRHKTKGFAKTFTSRQEVKSFLDEKPGRADTWEGHEMLNLGALATEPQAPAAMSPEIEDGTPAENKPVKRAPRKPAAQPVVRKVAQKTTVRKARR